MTDWEEPVCAAGAPLTRTRGLHSEAEPVRGDLSDWGVPQPDVRSPVPSRVRASPHGR